MIRAKVQKIFYLRIICGLSIPWYIVTRSELSCYLVIWSTADVGNKNHAYRFVKYPHIWYRGGIPLYNNIALEIVFDRAVISDDRLPSSLNFIFILLYVYYTHTWTYCYYSTIRYRHIITTSSFIRLSYYYIMYL